MKSNKKQSDDYATEFARKGAAARNEALSSKERSSLASRAAKARWKKQRKDKRKACLHSKTLDV